MDILCLTVYFNLLRCINNKKLYSCSSFVPTEMTAVTAANVNFKWDPKSLEIRTLAVERLLEPLVTQVGRRRGKINSHKEDCLFWCFVLIKSQSLYSRCKTLQTKDKVYKQFLCSVSLEQSLAMSPGRLCCFST